MKNIFKELKYYFLVIKENKFIGIYWIVMLIMLCIGIPAFKELFHVGFVASLLLGAILILVMRITINLKRKGLKIFSVFLHIFVAVTLLIPILFNLMGNYNELKQQKQEELFQELVDNTISQVENGIKNYEKTFLVPKISDTTTIAHLKNIEESYGGVSDPVNKANPGKGNAWRELDKLQDTITVDLAQVNNRITLFKKELSKFSALRDTDISIEDRYVSLKEMRKIFPFSVNISMFEVEVGMNEIDVEHIYFLIMLLILIITSIILLSIKRQHMSSNDNRVLLLALFLSSINALIGYYYKLGFDINFQILVFSIFVLIILSIYFIGKASKRGVFFVSATLLFIMLLGDTMSFSTSITNQEYFQLTENAINNKNEPMKDILFKQIAVKSDSIGEYISLHAEARARMWKESDYRPWMFKRTASYMTAISYKEKYEVTLAERTLLQDSLSSVFSNTILWEDWKDKKTVDFVEFAKANDLDVIYPDIIDLAIISAKKDIIRALAAVNIDLLPFLIGIVFALINLKWSGEAKKSPPILRKQIN